MGYMDLTVGGSDTAFACAIDVGDAMAKVLSKEFRDRTANEWNTVGPVNVAMIFEEVICLNDTFIENDKLRSLAKKVVAYLEKLIEYSKKVKEWDDKDMHLRRYRKMKNTIQKWLVAGD